MRECVLCGKLAYLTSDHIPARCLFPRGTQLITIPVCRECNNSASKDDEYFRAAVALRLEVDKNPVVAELLPQITRGLMLNRDRGNTGSIVRSMRDVDLYSASGIYLGRGATYDPEDPRICRVAARIVRGLYWREFQSRLPDSHGVAVYLVSNFDARAAGVIDGLRRLVNFATTGRVRVVHAKVFHYAMQSVPDKEGACVIVMTFYGYTPILCITMDRADHRDASRPLF
jgi:hypothetical protein